MPEQWIVEFYAEDNGTRPVEEFIRSLGRNPKLQAKVLRTVDLLEQFGSALPMPHSRSIVGHEFRELRIRFASDIARIFYAVMGEGRLVLLHGFVKKTQKTPAGELDMAQRRLDRLREKDRKQ